MTAGRSARLAVAASSALLMLQASSALADSVRAILVRPSGGQLETYVSGAARNAIAKLERPQCLAVLSDFRDEQGHVLKENLESLRMTAPEFLASLTFVDGSHLVLCGRPDVAAGTNPGQRVIAVCAATFARVRRQDPGISANVLIHEMLHALGLAADDASASKKINLQVGKRCGF
jgi:hypothetical protein